jgi:hypothetical protein
MVMCAHGRAHGYVPLRIDPHYLNDVYLCIASADCNTLVSVGKHDKSIIIWKIKNFDIVAVNRVSFTNNTIRGSIEFGLEQNPNKNSINMLYEFLEHNGHPIMADGSFIAYKAVRLDLKDHHSQTNEHKVGKVIRMDREGVDADPNSLCSRGLHVASWDYMKHFNNGNSRYFEVLINPADVVAVPRDYDGTKMRVCAYKVYREIKTQRNEEQLLTTQTKALQKSLKKKLKKGK